MPDFTIFIVDDDAAVLKALSRLLQSADYETKEYRSAKIFLSEHDASIPGCVLLDVVMPGLNGLEVQEILTREGIDRPVIFMTGRATIPDSVQAMRAGAIDFLTKPVDASKLLSAIRSAEERDTTRRHSSARRNGVLEKVAKLTRREREVLALMVAGQQSKNIGVRLGIYLNTVKVFRGRFFQKMEAKTLAELVRMTVGIPI
jgi:FixJ family two-component response regulator